MNLETTREQPPRSGLPGPLAGIAASFVLFTRFPMPRIGYDREHFRWAPAHAPLVGLFVGGLGALLFQLLQPLGVFVAAALAVGALLLATGAFHEDGLADSADALGGAHTRERLFAILKDSRVGTFGAAAVAVSILTRTLLLAKLGPATLWALPLASVAARVPPIWQLTLMPYVTDAAVAKHGDVARAGAAQALVASLWFAAALAIAHATERLESSRLAVLAVALFVLGILSGFQYRRRAGGVTGDFLGATEQLGEIAALAVLAWD